MASIHKSQLEYIASGELDKLGVSPDVFADVSGHDVMLQLARVLVEELRNSATEKGVVATKRLRSSINPTHVTQEANGLSVGIEMEDYWDDVEYGTPPGRMPAIKDIEEWISAKGIQVQKNTGQSGSEVLADRHSLAVMIANKIKRKGTIKRFGYKGSKFIDAVINEASLAVIAEFLAELQLKNIRAYMKTPSNSYSQKTIF